MLIAFHVKVLLLRLSGIGHIPRHYSRSAAAFVIANFYPDFFLFLRGPVIAAMNCPSRPDDTLDRPDWNQNPPFLNADGTTRQDLNGISNAREQRDHVSKTAGAASATTLPSEIQQNREDVGETEPTEKPAGGGVETATSQLEQPESASRFPHLSVFPKNFPPFQRAIQAIAKLARFVGPGFLVAVAYIDPGNYSTDVAAGADTKYALLFVVLMSNLFAIFLQSLCIKLGSVTGLNLAENCRAHLPRWLTIILYIFAEAAIVATDIAEVPILSLKTSLFKRLIVYR